MPKRIKKKRKIKKDKGAPPKGLRTMIENLVEEIQTELGLKDYQVRYSYSQRTVAHGDGKETASSISIDTRYLDAIVTIYPCVVDLYKAKQYNRVKSVIYHELAHFRTEHLVRLARDRFANAEEIEEQWERLTEVVGRLMEGYVYYKKHHKKK